MNTEQFFAQQAQRRQRDKIKFQVETVLWLIAGAVTIYATDLFRVVASDRRVNRGILNIGLLMILGELFIFMYLIVFLRMRGVTSTDYNVVAPRTIHIATAMGLAIFVCLNAAMWPIWSWLSPVILGVLFMAFIEVLALI